MKATIVHPNDVETGEKNQSRWVGEPPDLRRVTPALGTDQVKAYVVRFPAGTRSRPHTHGYDQVLHYISGTGVVAVDGEEDQLVQAGEFVLLPANLPHMHGAAADGPAVHVSIMREVDMDFDCEIPESWNVWREP